MAPPRAGPPGRPTETDGARRAGGLRIGFLNSWPLDPAVGSGSAAAIVGLGAALEAQGHRVTHLGPPPDAHGRLRQRLRYNLAVRRPALRGRFDLLVGFDLDGFLTSGRTRAPYVVALKGIVADERRLETGMARARLGLLTAPEAWNARRASVVIVTSRYSREVAVRRYGLPRERVRVVPEGIDLAEWGRPPRRPGSARSEHTVLSVARQYRRKNTATLLRAFARVRAELPDARLRIVGDGPELPRLRTLATHLGLGESARFLGALRTAAEVRAEYANADLFCLPSRQEGFGIVFLEAMAAGLPVVASHAAAVPEVVPDGRAGRLVDPGNPEALAAALLELLRDAELRSHYGHFARTHVRRYAWPGIARLFLTETVPTGRVA
ncbi:MAG: glycosyltransferase family 4 protein [Gemmatimonadota bacterium]